MSREELDSTLKGEEDFGYAPWKADPLGSGEKLDAKRRARGWNEKVVDELVEGLEDEVRALVQGRVPQTVPWKDADESH
jgi:hypothetical protein